MMKRVLSVLLILCMLASTCVLLGSCGKSISKKDVEKDPLGALGEATENAVSSFFTLDSKASEVLEEALKKGAFNVTLESDELFGGDLTKISETIYVDEKAEKLVSDTVVVYRDEELSGLIYMDKESIAASSASLFGVKDTFVLKYADVAKKLEDSDLAEMMELDDDDIEEIVEMFQTILEQAEDKKASDKKFNEVMKQAYELMEQTITTEKLEDEDGKKYDAIITTYTLTNDSLEELVELFMDELLDGYMSVSDFKDTEEEITEALDSLNEVYDLEATITFNVNKKTGQLVEVSFECNMDAKKNSGAQDVSVEGTLSFSETKILLDVSGKAGGEKFSVEVVIEKTDDDKNIEYEFEANVGMGSAKLELIKGSFTYEKKSGDFELDVDVATGELYGEDVPSSTNLIVQGNLKVEKGKSVTLAVDKIKADKTTLDLKLEVSAKVVSKIPEASTSKTQDVLEMSESDIEEIFAYLDELFAPELKGTYEYGLSSLVTYSMTFDGKGEVTITMDTMGVTTSSTGTYEIVGDTLVISDLDDESMVDIYEKTYQYSLTDYSVTLDDETWYKVD